MEYPSICKLSGTRSGQLTTFDPATGNKTVFVQPHCRDTLATLSGCGVVTRLWMTLPGWFWRHWDETAPVDPTVLRLTILRIYYGGSTEPSIEAPIGDFFGVGHCEYRHYTSRYLGMSSGGLYCYLPMPFVGGLRLEVENLHATEPVELFYNINYDILEELPPDTGLLHAAFRCGSNSGAEPLEIADITGAGQLVGCTLSIQGRDPNYMAYLEAPEHIWVDGEETASIVGTGLEDYFNGGWYFRDGEFCCETHGVPLKDPLRSMISMYRFHEADRICFTCSLRFAFINPWNADRLRPFIYSGCAYYYMRSPHAAAAKIPHAAELTKLYRMRDSDHQSIP